MVQEQTLRDELLVHLSRQMAAAIGAQPFQCATNAWRALIEFPDLFRAAGRLVEGWFVIETDERVVMNEHVWCELDDRIVDPSVLLLVPETTPVFYFAGLSRTWEEAEALEGALFPHVRFDVYGADGLGHSGYQAARDAARRKVYALALRARPPKAMQFLTAQDLNNVLAEIPPDSPPPSVEGGSLDTPLSRPTSGLEQRCRVGEPGLDLALSETVAQTVGARAGRCWYNVRDTLLQMLNPFFFACAVEGWLVEQYNDRIELIEHGWVRFRERIIDPTIMREDPGVRRVDYVPGLEWSWAEVQRTADYPLPLARFLVASPTYQRACQEALDRAEKLAWQTGFPLVSSPGFVLLRSVEDQGPFLHIWEFPVPATLSPLVPLLLEAWKKGKQL
jgi:hypothetical protein